MQWINGYPSRDMIADDISRGECFVICDGQGSMQASTEAPQSENDSSLDGAQPGAREHEHICGVFMFALGDDPTYAIIEDGEWLNDEPYGVIHRIASDKTARGVLATAVSFALQHTDNIRIDTHADNAIMQRALKKAGFSQCGTIYCHDGSPRVAFHLARERV